MFSVGGLPASLVTPKEEQENEEEMEREKEKERKRIKKYIM